MVDVVNVCVVYFSACIYFLVIYILLLHFIACECNDQATLCHPESGKCFCTTKGLAGDHCEKCDGVNHYHPDPSIKGSCYCKYFFTNETSC